MEASCFSPKADWLQFPDSHGFQNTPSNPGFNANHASHKHVFVKLRECANVHRNLNGIGGLNLACVELAFQFGGKLVTFENSKFQQQGAEQQQQQQQCFHVYISQVVTEKEFLSRSDQLQEAVQGEAFINYCQKKIEAAKNNFEKNVWSFLKVISGRACTSQSS